jgi:glycosyltransferase involved in cell wall biosynthesis
VKIAIINPFQFRYARGIERLTWALASHLIRRGTCVDLLTWKWPEPVQWGATPRGMNVKQVPHFRYGMRWAAVSHYVSWLAAGNYDWVLIYFAGYGEAPALGMLNLIRRQRTCVVLQYPGDLVPHRYREFEHFALARRADQMIAVSHHVANGAARWFARKCQVVGNGVDVDQFAPSLEFRTAVRKRLGIDESDKVLISVAALEERKGMQWVIRALPRLLPEFPGLRYWIVGEGTYRKSLQEEIYRLGLGRHVWLRGTTSDVARLAAAADVGCLLANGEAFGIAVLEYMATQLPVVTSCHPPFDELIDRAWGEIVDETDTARVAETIRGLLRDPSRCRSMGRAGRQQVVNHHTWDHVADGYLGLLEGELAEGCPSQ